MTFLFSFNFFLKFKRARFFLDVIGLKQGRNKHQASMTKGCKLLHQTISIYKSLRIVIRLHVPMLIASYSFRQSPLS